MAHSHRNAYRFPSAAAKRRHLFLVEKEGCISWRMLDSRAKGLIERVGARANMDAPESIHSPNAGPLKRITRLILDCKIERGEKKRKRRRRNWKRRRYRGEESLSIAEHRSFSAAPFQEAVSARVINAV